VSAYLGFNLIPAFPLDGGRVLRSVLWWGSGSRRRSTRWASLLGQGFAWLLVGLGLLQVLAGNWPGGIWMGLIGLSLFQAARGSYQSLLVREALRGEPVGRLMSRPPVAAPPDLDQAAWVEDYADHDHRKAFPVASNGHVEWLISTRALSRFPRQEWPRHTVREVMEANLEGLEVSPETDALEALERLQRSGGAGYWSPRAGNWSGSSAAKTSPVSCG
jgi:hypothetical protein